jgi:hypothetical protein
MIRGAGRSKKAVGANDESEDEENSPGVDVVPEEVESLTLMTPSALASSVPHLAEYPMPVVVNPSLEDYPRHTYSGHVFEEAFVENSYRNMPEIRSHADIFSPDAPPIMLGQWPTSDLYAIPVNLASHLPSILQTETKSSVVTPIGSPPKQPYRGEGYSTDVYGRFPTW